MILGYSPIITTSTPDDVRIMSNALQQAKGTIDVDNCGTAMRFLTAYFAKQPGANVILTGCKRMQERPIAPLVDSLRSIGAMIDYLQEEGFPPLKIVGKKLDLQKPILLDSAYSFSTQFISALLLIGANIQTDVCSPYIDMTRSIIKMQDANYIEYDWSAAAFWYERVALGIEDNVFLEGLKADDIQGDKIVHVLYTKLGVHTDFQSNGILLTHQEEHSSIVTIDFTHCPDLYPAIAVTCSQLGIALQATGTDRLRYKESNRLATVEENLLRILEGKIVQSYDDHRIAMSFLAAGYNIDHPECINKSYPDFVRQLSLIPLSEEITRIVPRRGVNDDGKGKKAALKKLIEQAQTPYVWFTDDDVFYPSVVPVGLDADLYILPLRMQTRKDTLLARLQMAEYAAIQSLTLLAAKHNHAVMCSGANLIVRRDIWLTLFDELKPEIASGDDMFLLEACKRHHLRIDVLEEACVEATVEAMLSVKAFFRQRMRWAGKAPHYTDSDIRACGLLVLIANLLQIVCPLFVVIKFVVDYNFIRLRSDHTRIGTAILLEIIYPFYMLFCVVGGLSAMRHRTKW